MKRLSVSLILLAAPIVLLLMIKGSDMLIQSLFNVQPVNSIFFAIMMSVATGVTLTGYLLETSKGGNNS